MSKVNAPADWIVTLLERAGTRGVYAFDGRGSVEAVRVAFRRGQRAPKGEPIVSTEWTHACVEGDGGWTDLETGEFCPEGDRKYRPDPGP